MLLKDEEFEKVKKLAKDFMDNTCDDKTKSMEFQTFWNEFLLSQSRVLDGVYFDIQQIKKHCDSCSYKYMPPADGSFFDKADNFMKERAKWTKFTWIVVGPLLSVLFLFLTWIATSYMTKIDKISQQLTEIQIEIVQQVKINTGSIRDLENMIFKKSK